MIFKKKPKEEQYRVNIGIDVGNGKTAELWVTYKNENTAEAFVERVYDAVWKTSSENPVHLEGMGSFRRDKFLFCWIRGGKN